MFANKKKTLRGNDLKDISFTTRVLTVSSVFNRMFNGKLTNSIKK